MFTKIAFAFVTALVLGTSALATQASAGPGYGHTLSLGGNYFDTRAEPALTRHLVRRLKALGDDVHLDHAAA